MDGTGRPSLPSTPLPFVLEEEDVEEGKEFRKNAQSHTTVCVTGIHQAPLSSSFWPGKWTPGDRRAAYAGKEGACREGARDQRGAPEPRERRCPRPVGTGSHFPSTSWSQGPQSRRRGIKTGRLFWKPVTDP